MKKNIVTQEIFANIKQIFDKPNGVIAFPTDTVWGIGCIAESPLAVERIYEIKGRDKTKPLILLGSKIEYLIPYVSEIHPNAKKIIEKYLPGAVTLVLPKSEKTPDYLTSGFDTIGIRIPNHKIFLEVLENSVENHVLATTSANLSSMGATDLKEDVIKNIGDKIDYILDDFEISPQGTESTVVLVDKNGDIKVLRQGAIKIEI